MLVKNAIGTAEKTCRCGPWLQHFKNFAGWLPSMCAEKKCMGTELFGAHVRKVGGDGKTFIVPLCRAHNATTGEIEIGDFYLIVSANKAETCERS
jgi:hypothetical protein